MWISPCSLTWQAVFDLGIREQARNSRSSSSPAVAWARYFFIPLVVMIVSFQWIWDDWSRTDIHMNSMTHPVILSFLPWTCSYSKKQCSGSLGSVIFGPLGSGSLFVCTDPDLDPAPETDPSIYSIVTSTSKKILLKALISTLFWPEWFAIFEKNLFFAV